ncbi:MAG: homocysteine S-methyltransferase family protein [Candidatus Tectomicrobia bacterium]|nr:homocysteine S-methyltransferase family protein [Candidatus Tectomicrobia bacterium]
MAETLREALGRRMLVADGAMGTMLQKAGLKIGGAPEEMNVTHPEVVRDIHRRYFEAGSDFVLTNTFGGTELRLRESDFSGKVREFNLRAVELARSVAPEGRFVVASVGPSGQLLDPLGTMTYEECVENFRAQVAALHEAGVDAINIETMSDATEAKAAIAAARSVSATLLIIATMAFDSGKEALFTMMGVDAVTAATELLAAGADVVGANCGTGVEQAIVLLRTMRHGREDKLFSAKPNAGIPEIINGAIVYSLTPQMMAEKMKRFVKLGVNIVGGCCGSTPEHIRLLAEMVARETGRT